MTTEAQIKAVDDAIDQLLEMDCETNREVAKALHVAFERPEIAGIRQSDDAVVLWPSDRELNADEAREYGYAPDDGLSCCF